MGAAEGDADTPGGANGVGRPAGAAVAAGAAEGGGLVKIGAGGFTCATAAATHASKHAAVKAAPENREDFTRYAILASSRLTAEASSVL